MQSPLDRAVGTIATGVPTRIATGVPQPATAASSLPPPVKSMRDAGITRPLVVAIDAGHGGQDTGALGRSGAREKDVTLAIARELARQVDATPGLKAYLTRDSDYFIPLPQRARKAHAAHADIFVSIHADSFTSPEARGAGVFVLSTRGASSQRARWLADKENAADVIGGNRVRAGDSVLTSVLLDLTQSGNLKASEDAAGYVLGNLDAIGNLHKGEVERANFAVLRTSDNMPAMLVETGFISNPGEEARLRSKAYQQQLATAILGGINRYFTTQPPPGTLYALRAQATQDGGAGIGAGGSP
jgi:N-acetylmuramoyl-L-alanine amidase